MRSGGPCAHHPGTGTGLTASACLRRFATTALTCRQQQQAARGIAAEVISAADGTYRPAAPTWGVYERPKNMSKAFGGGRSLRPEDSVMSKQEQAEYDKKLHAKLARYRKSSGIEVDPKLERECTELTEQGVRSQRCSAPRRTSQRPGHCSRRCLTYRRSAANAARTVTAVTAAGATGADAPPVSLHPQQQPSGIRFSPR